MKLKNIIAVLLSVTMIATNFGVVVSADTSSNSTVTVVGSKVKKTKTTTLKEALAEETKKDEHYNYVSDGKHSVFYADDVDKHVGGFLLYSTKRELVEAPELFSDLEDGFTVQVDNGTKSSYIQSIDKSLKDDLKKKKFVMTYLITLGMTVASDYENDGFTVIHFDFIPTEYYNKKASASLKATAYGNIVIGVAAVDSEGNVREFCAFIDKDKTCTHFIEQRFHSTVGYDAEYGIMSVYRRVK